MKKEQDSESNDNASTIKKEHPFLTKLRTMPYNNDRIGQASIRGISELPSKETTNSLRVRGLTPEEMAAADERVIQLLMKKDGMTRAEAELYYCNPW